MMLLTSITMSVTLGVNLMSGKLTLGVDLAEGLELGDAVEIVADFCEVLRLNRVRNQDNPIDSSIRYLDGGSLLTIVYEP